MKVGTRIVRSKPARALVVGILLVGTIAMTVMVINLWDVVLAAPPIGGEPISVQGPTSIVSNSQGTIQAVVAADLDTDGHPDLAFGQSDALRIVANTGVTTTEWALIVTVTGAPYDIQDVQAVDLDRDGALDLVSASADGTGDSQLRLWQNPTSPFANSWTVSNTLATSAISLTSVASGDLDRNGTSDLVSGGLDGVLRLWSNPLTGTQSFDTAWPSPATVSTLGDQVRQVVVVDVDRDGWLDIVEAAGDDGSGAVRLWRNPGDPFTTAWTVSNTVGTSSSTVASISVGDLDDDGALDIVAGLASGDVVAWRNPLTGTQSFATSWGGSTTLGSLSLPIVGLAVTDADHDGALDVVATGAGTPSVTSSVLVAWRNLGLPFSGGWSQLTIGSTSDSTFELVAADFDADGDDDLVTASGNTGTDSGALQFWTNSLIRSSARFETLNVSNHTIDLLSGSDLHAMDVHDMDRDGRPDVVVATMDGRLLVLENDGTPFVNSWPSSVVGTSSGFFSVIVGDLDGDGCPDVATSSTLTGSGGLVHIWRHDGDPFAGTWVSQTVGMFPRQVMDLALGDVGREGNLQIVASTGITTTFDDYWEHDVPVSDDNAIWLLHHSAGDPFASAWISSTVCTTTYSANSVALGDLDNDGWLDIVFGTDHAPLGTTAWPDTSGFYDGPAYQVRACRNLGNPYSATGWQVYDVGRDDAPESMALGHRFWGAHVWNVTVGDLDNDGYPDVASAGGPEGDHQILVYENDGTPFDGSVWEPTAVGYGSRTDGGPSTCPGTYPEDCPWLENGIGAVDIGDLNGDGWPDLVSGFADHMTTLPIWINTGIPFGETVTDTHWIRQDLSTGARPVYNAEAVDLDSDGRLDVAAVNYIPSPFTGQVRAWRNLGGIARHDFESDTSLTTIENGASEARLSFGITHNGRSYDHGLELSSLEVRLYASGWMNQVKAESLFQSLQIYRDTSGDGEWQLTDSPVVTLTDFSLLDNGYITFTFPSGDALVAVSPGQTVTYFIVFNMQHTASQASANSFRLQYTPHEAFLIKDKDTQASVSLEEAEQAFTRWSGITAVPAAAASTALGAAPSTIWADGASTSTITATVMTAYDYPVLDGTVVTFTAEAGTLPSSPYTSTTVNGTATTVLTSGTDLGTVTVTATVNATATGTVEVEFVPGPRASLRINDAPGTGGSEVTTHTMSADDTYTVYVAAYDAQMRFMDNPTDVTWGGTGVVSGNLSSTTSVSSTSFTPVLFGTGTITVADGDDHVDATETITVTPGALHHIVIRDSADGGGVEVDTHAMTADDAFTVYAAGYDADDNYIDDVVVTWAGTGVVAGLLAPTSGVSTTFTAGPAGLGAIQADAGGGIIDTTGTITVNPGNLHHIVIRDAADGGGAEVDTHTMTTDDEFTVCAAGYDSDDNFIADQAVDWATTDALDSQTGTGSNFTFAPSTANTSGTITADAGTGITDATGTITVDPGNLHHIVIRDAVEGAGAEVDTHTMTTDDEFTVYAAGYDADDNFIADQEVDWATTGTLDSQTVSGSSFTFAPMTADTSGMITADAGGTITDTTGTITVTLGALHRIVIRDAAGGAGAEVDAHAMMADDEFTVYAAGYDADDNCIDDVSVTWTGTGVVAGRLAPTSGVSTTFTAGPTGTGAIHADAGSSITDTTGIITVNPGDLHHIMIRDEAGGGGAEVDAHTMTTDDGFTVYAAGYDADDNFVADQVVNWATTGTLDNQMGTGSSFTFSPMTAHTSGTITADAGGTITDATGTITVTLGTLHHILVRNAAGDGGAEVDTHTMSTHETLSVWAAGYDADGNYISDTVATWTGTGVVAGRLAPTSGVSTMFTAGPAGTGAVQADAGGGVTGTTGTITVTPGDLDHIVIRDEPGGSGTEVHTHTVSAGLSFSVWAAGYDVENNYIDDISVTWTGTGVVIGRLAPTSGISTTFTAAESGTGTIEADDGEGHTDATGTITVTYQIFLPLVLSQGQ